MSKTSETNWIESGKKPRTFSEMREAFSQIRGMMSDWRKKQEMFDNTPDEDLETRVANLSALVEKMKAVGHVPVSTAGRHRNDVSSGSDP